MTAPAWTPGPWTVEPAPSPQDPHVQIWAPYTAAEQEKHPASRGKWIAEIRTYRTTEERDATAAVMAAAPDLYAALEALMVTDAGDRGYIAVLMRARAALARARGES